MADVALICDIWKSNISNLFFCKGKNQLPVAMATSPKLQNDGYISSLNCYCPPLEFLRLQFTTAVERKIEQGEIADTQRSIQKKKPHINTE